MAQDARWGGAVSLCPAGRGSFGTFRAYRSSFSRRRHTMMVAWRRAVRSIYHWMERWLPTSCVRVRVFYFRWGAMNCSNSTAGLLCQEQTWRQGLDVRFFALLRLVYDRHIYIYICVYMSRNFRYAPPAFLLAFCFSVPFTGVGSVLWRSVPYVYMYVVFFFSFASYTRRKYIACSRVMGVWPVRTRQWTFRHTIDSTGRVGDIPSSFLVTWGGHRQ